MIPVFGILLYPVVFLVLYAVCEVIFPTRNTAMIVSLLAAFPCCLTYVRLRTRFAARAKAKKAARQSAQERLYGLMLLDKSAFEALFPDCLCDQTAGGVTEESLLGFLRAHGCKSPIEIVSLHGITPGAEALAALMRVELHPLSEQTILSRTQDVLLPDLPPLKTHRRLDRIKAFLTSAPARRFCLRYGLLLFFFSILTPYRLYYWLFGGVLLGLFAFSFLRSRLNRRNQIPVLRSE